MAQVDVKVVIEAVDRASATMKNFGGVAEKVHDSFTDLVNRSKGASLAFAGSLVLLGKGIIDTASDMQQAKVAFDTMIGSGDKASKLLKEIADFAARTPFELPGVIQAAKQLIAMGASVEDVLPELKALGDLAAGTGAPLERLILNFGQVRLQGKLTGRELRDFAVNGVGLLEQLSKQMGKSTEDISKMVEDGAIGFDDVKKAFIAMTSEGGKFSNLMDKQSKTVGGIISNMRDQFTRAALAIAGISTEAETFGQVIQGGMFDILAKGLQNVLTVLNAVTPQIKDFLGAFVQNQTAVLTVIGALTAGLLGAIAVLVSFLAPFLLLVTIGAAVGAAISFVIQNFSALMPYIEGITAGLITLGTIILITLIPAFVAWAAAALAAAAGTIAALLPVLIPVAAIGIAVQVLANAWKTNWNGIQEKTAAVVGWFKSHVMPFFEEGFGKTILSILDKVVFGWVGGFAAIKSAVDSVINAISGLINKAKEMAEKVKGGLKIPGFQTGGIVPGPIGQPQLAMVHGGEEVLPAGRAGGGGSGGGSGLTFNVNIGMYAGSEIEKRNVARELYLALVQLASARNVSVAEMMGR